MPYPINGPALMELQIVGRLHGQTTRTVLHYAKADFTAIADGLGHLQAFSLAFTGALSGAYRNCCSNEFTIQRVTYQWIKPIRYRALQVFVAPNAGTVVQNSLPSGAAAVLSKQTRRSGPKWRGRLYMPAVPATFESDSLINQTGGAAYATLADLLDNVQLINGVNMYPWVNLDAPTGAQSDTDDHTIDTVVPTDPIRYQRRREVGVGE